MRLCASCRIKLDERATSVSCEGLERSGLWVESKAQRVHIMPGILTLILAITNRTSHGDAR